MKLYENAASNQGGPYLQRFPFDIDGAALSKKGGFAGAGSKAVTKCYKH